MHSAVGGDAVDAVGSVRHTRHRHCSHNRILSGSIWQRASKPELDTPAWLLPNLLMAYTLQQMVSPLVKRHTKGDEEGWQEGNQRSPEGVSHSGLQSADHDRRRRTVHPLPVGALTRSHSHHLDNQKDESLNMRIGKLR